MDDFAKYIKDNKEKLEPDHVDHKVWLGIENELLKSKHKKHSLAFKIIALIAILFLGSVAWFSMNNQNIIPNEERIIAKYDLTKYNFTQQVSFKKQQLNNAKIPKDKIEDFQILLQQLEFMDGQFQDYRLYIDENGYQEFIGDQILNFYKSKIELLDKIQSEIEKINYYERLQPSAGDRINIKI